MQLETNFSLKSLNTFHVEAAAARYVRFESENEIVDFLSRHPLADQARLVLGGGSNVLFVDDFDGCILHPQLKGIHVIETDRQYVRIKAMAGENWDDLVALAVTNGWGGIENLSLIPGSVGASVVQNIGAYGVELKAVIDSIETISIDRLEKVTFLPGDCAFDYRFSNFKGSWSGQFIVTAVVFKLNRQPDFNLDYRGVNAAVEKLGSTNLATIRQAIINIRQSKLPDPAEVGNAGSFFKNPVIGAGALEGMLYGNPDLPYYPLGNNQFKLAAAWLIERCGWKGKRKGKAAVHDRQALVLVNLGGARGHEILQLSEQVQASVHEMFDIELQREVLVIPQQFGV